MQPKFSKKQHSSEILVSRSQGRIRVYGFDSWMGAEIFLLISSRPNVGHIQRLSKGCCNV